MPILCSTFYSQYLLGSLPPGETFNIKKTSFKKLSTYFTELEELKVLRVGLATKGVEQIEDIDFKYRSKKIAGIVRKF